MPVALVVITVVIMVATPLLFRWRRNRRLQYIRNASFPSALRNKLAKQYPQLEPQDIALILRTLRDYFVMTHHARGRMLAMPSAAVDSAWHEFILCTAAYARFCQQAFGRFLHHTPSEAMGSATRVRESLKLSWKIACELENIDPHHPQKLPRLFAIDARLNIAGGFFYTLPAANTGLAAPGSPDARDASDIGCTSGCGGNCSDSGSSSDSGCCGSSCGGGCGGGGD